MWIMIYITDHGDRKVDGHGVLGWVQDLNVTKLSTYHPNQIIQMLNIERKKEKNNNLKHSFTYLRDCDTMHLSFTS